MIIKLIDGNYVKEISISGRITMCPLAYQAKQFYNTDGLRAYTDFLNKKHSSKAYDVLDFDYHESLSNWIKDVDNR